jgi:hypothetical protein
MEREMQQKESILLPKGSVWNHPQRVLRKEDEGRLRVVIQDRPADYHDEQRCLRESWSRRKRSLVLLMATTLVGLAACDQPQSQMPVAAPVAGSRVQQTGPDPYSSAPSEIRINDHVLRIPSNYVAQNPGHGKFVSMYAYWPRLVAFKQKGDNAARDRFDRIEILLDGRHNVAQAPQGDIHGRLRKNTALGPRRLNEELGLWEYHQRTATAEPWMPWRYVAADESALAPDGQPLSIRCGGIERMPGDRGSVECQVDYFIRSDVLLTYRFFHKHIGDWQAIDKQVREFVESLFAGVGVGPL